MLSPAEANHFASRWIAAWNARDLEQIVSHYREDVRFSSPFAITHAGAEDGVVHTRLALRRYFERALKAYPDLHFKLIAVLPGVNSVALHYRSVGGRRAIEVMELDPRGQVSRVTAHYGPPQKPTHDISHDRAQEAIDVNQ
jgi:hypothetical protein